jgi:hypothetical protein
MRSWLVPAARGPDEALERVRAVVVEAIASLQEIERGMEAAAPRHLDAPTPPAADRQSPAAAPMVCLPEAPTASAAAELFTAAAPAVAVVVEVEAVSTGATKPLRRIRRGSFFEAVAAMEAARETPTSSAGESEAPRPSEKPEAVPEPSPPPAGRLPMPMTWGVW